MEIFITPTFDSQIALSGQQLVLYAGQTARLTPDNTKRTLISVVPINESADNYLLPYCFGIDLASDRVCECEFCDAKIIDGVCNIRLLPKSLSRTQLFTTMTFMNKKYTLIQNAFDHTVSIKGEGINQELSLDFPVKNFNFYTKSFGGSSYLFLEFAGVYRAYLMFGKAIDKPIFSDSVNSYEWKDNVINIAQKFEGELSQIKLSKYSFESECRLVDEQVGYLGDKPKLRTNSHLVPYLFLECVLAGNISFAQELLTPDFASNLSVEMLRDYFPEFDSFCQYIGGTKLQYNKVSLIKKGHLVGVLDFEIVNGKIANIISF